MEGAQEVLWEGRDMGAGEDVRAVLGDGWWEGMLRESGELERAAEVRCPGAVRRLDALLQAWAVGFAAVRPDVVSPDLAASRRGLRADEAAGFLAALDARVLHVDSAGFVVPQAFRSKASGGRYALFSRNGRGMAVNLEYLIQLAAAAELLVDHGVAGADICFEQGEFDAVVEDGGGLPVLAMEAKARVEGTDGLLQLLHSLLRLGVNPQATARNNHRRKYAALLNMAARGPVVLWLVADGARWAFDAKVGAGTLRLTPRRDNHSLVCREGGG
ncbi:hypothetical protein ACIBMX_46555 [Streptomyces phaeochromogenes]|uniref:hypothetical protein n=1 Tax=Streptomyces phaeochromogenes TaxID=1923 RepID=UPI0034009AED|nr:hypothetical protein OG478_01920 [Streptomyces phaeochromogenes]WTA01441.1 hypothetical protein OHB08_03450 [Streptomyces phaeochromogenes]